jgi:hypothetical protein
MLLRPILYGSIDIMKLKWSSLTRHEQKLMARLYGGGSTRGQDPKVISELRQLGLIESDGLSPSGNNLCKLLELALASRRSITARAANGGVSLRM